MGACILFVILAFAHSWGLNVRGRKWSTSPEQTTYATCVRTPPQHDQQIFLPHQTAYLCISESQLDTCFAGTPLGASPYHFHSVRSCTLQQHLLLSKKFTWLKGVHFLRRQSLTDSGSAKENPTLRGGCMLPRSAAHAARTFPSEEVSPLPLHPCIPHGALFTICILQGRPPMRGPDCLACSPTT